jgi:hypothetical protein
VSVVTMFAQCFFPFRTVRGKVDPRCGSAGT